MIVRIVLCVVFAAVLSGCDSPTNSTPIASSTAALTIGLFRNSARASPGKSMVWTALSADTSAVQLSPASGSGRGQVELFVPANNGAQRLTLVTIAGQTARITESGR